MTGAQKDLFAPGLEERFLAFDKANPHVYPLIFQTALRLAESGRKRIGIAEIIEEIRYDTRILTNPADYPVHGGTGFKINNSYRAFYARKLIRHRPDLFAGIIQTRAQRSA